MLLALLPSSRRFAHSFPKSNLTAVVQRLLAQNQNPTFREMDAQGNTIPTDFLDDHLRTGTSPNLHFVRLTNVVTSTQDEARTLLDQGVGGDGDCVAVVATQQSKGRGTQGRQWKAAPGNLYLTVCVPISKIPVMMTLLPLHVGVIVAERIAALIQACQGEEDLLPRVTVKWPNDVLVNSHKISGCLIENHTTGNDSWFLVGIGVNVASTPDISNLPGKHTRGATCIRDWCSERGAGNLLGQDTNMDIWTTTATVLGLDIANAIAEWVSDGNSLKMTTKNRLVIDNFERLAEFGQVYELRGSIVDEDKGGFEGEKVVTLGVQADGQLRVRGENGKERLLMADYFF